MLSQIINYLHRTEQICGGTLLCLEPQFGVASQLKVLLDQRCTFGVEGEAELPHGPSSNSFLQTTPFPTLLLWDWMEWNIYLLHPQESMLSLHLLLWPWGYQKPLLNSCTSDSLRGLERECLLPKVTISDPPHPLHTHYPPGTWSSRWGVENKHLWGLDKLFL